VNLPSIKGAAEPTPTKIRLKAYVLQLLTVRNARHQFTVMSTVVSAPQLLWYFFSGDTASGAAMGDGDRKTYWGFPETVTWIRTRDEERVTAMWDMSEEGGIGPAIYSAKTELDPRLLLLFAGTDFDGDCQAGALQANPGSSCIHKPTMMEADKAIGDLLRKVASRRVRMTAIRCDGNSNEQIPVPSAELNDLEFRISPGDRVAPVGLWSRSRRVLVWRSPQFLSADVVGAWPAPNTKTAAVVIAVLHYLREIMIPEAPLTKREALQRCMVEVPNAYPEAFKRAWAKLDPSCKRARGKHGLRAR
jgi:hypothetical protein